jgi:hypothetical protein
MIISRSSRFYLLLLIVLITTDANALTYEKIHIHGFVSQGYMVSDHNNYLADTSSGTLEFNDAAINISRQFYPNFHIGCQLYTRDIGNVGNHKVEIDWAFADYRMTDLIGFRLGKIKIPHGLYNETRDIDMLRTFIFLPPVYYDISRSTINAMNGIDIYGNYQFETLGNLEYQILNGVKRIEADSGWSRYMERRGMDITSFDSDYVQCGKLTWYPNIEGLRLGVSGILFDMNADAEIDMLPLPPQYRISGPDLEYRLRNFIVSVNYIEYTLREIIFAAEYMTFRGDLAIKTLAPGLKQIVSEIPIKTDSFYLSMTYRLTDYLEMGGYYAVFWPDASDTNGKTLLPNYLGWHKEAALCFRFDITNYLTLKGETHLMDGGALMMPQDNPEGVEQRTALFLLKLAFSF